VALLNIPRVTIYKEAEIAVAPTVTSVNPAQGNIGQTIDVVITGTNFTGATAVSFEPRAQVQSFTVDSDTQITATISCVWCSWADVSVTTPAGTGTLPHGFVVVQPTTPKYTPQGTTVFNTSGGTVYPGNWTPHPRPGWPSPPSGASFPYGIFEFKIQDINPGATVTVTITYPGPLPVGTQYWKFQNMAWINCTSLMGDDDGDNVLTLTLTDGGLGDADLVANGTIDDPGGPVLPSSAPRKGVAEGSSSGESYTAVSGSPILRVATLSVPGQAKVNQPVTITANIVNDGNLEGSTKVTLKINGKAEQTKLVNVGPGGTSQVKFTVTKAEPGNYSVIIGSQRASFVVGEAKKSPEPDSGGSMIPMLLMGLLFLVVIVVLMLSFRRRSY